MGLLKKSKEKCKEKELKSCLKKQPVAIEISCCENEPSCEPENCCEVQQCCECIDQAACCKPGCSLRKPCMACIKRGVKVQIFPKKCKKACVNFCECPKKLTIKTRCEINKNECHETDEADCCQEDDQNECDDVIDYCKLAREKSKEEENCCKTFEIKKSNSCRNFKKCPCTSCKITTKCERICCNDNDDEKCCETSYRVKNSCQTSKQTQKCEPENSFCMSSSYPKSYSCIDKCCNEKVNENCAVFEQGDCMPCLEETNCYRSEIPSTCLPSVGSSFVVPHITKQTNMPCPCGSRSCGNPVLIFQQAIQSPPCITTKRFP